MSYTKGPWKVGKWKDGHEVWVDAPNGDQDFKYGKWEGLATVYGNEDHVDFNESHEKCLANARLIAAAPEMLEALKVIVENYEYDTDECEAHKGPACDRCQSIINARVLIAKATGE